MGSSNPSALTRQSSERPYRRRPAPEPPAQPTGRLRRITGYLVGSLDHFNNAKRAEEHDRVKHSVVEE